MKRSILRAVTLVLLALAVGSSLSGCVVYDREPGYHWGGPPHYWGGPDRGWHRW